MTKKLPKFTIFSMIFFLLEGCASAYLPQGGIRGGWGYADQSLGNNIYEVKAGGNGFTSQQRVDDIVLRRSAELTINNGFKYFIILDGSYMGVVSDETMFPDGVVSPILRSVDDIRIQMTNTNTSNAKEASKILQETNYLIKNT